MNGFHFNWNLAPADRERKPNARRVRVINQALNQNGLRGLRLTRETLAQMIDDNAPKKPMESEQENDHDGAA